MWIYWPFAVPYSEETATGGIGRSHVLRRKLLAEWKKRSAYSMISGLGSP